MIKGRVGRLKTMAGSDYFKNISKQSSSSSTASIEDERSLVFTLLRTTVTRRKTMRPISSFITIYCANNEIRQVRACSSLLPTSS